MPATIAELITQGWSPAEAPKFKKWMEALDRKVMEQTGLGIDDLPDWDFADHFESGESVKDAFVCFMEDQFPIELQ